jgi:hypothetical protein
MNNDFQEKLAFGQEGEHIVAECLLKKGFSIQPFAFY